MAPITKTIGQSATYTLLENQQTSQYYVCTVKFEIDHLTR